MNTELQEKLLNTSQVAAMTDGNISPSTLTWYRHLNDGRGPKWFRIGRKVVYRESDVVAWLDGLYAEAQGGDAA